MEFFDMPNGNVSRMELEMNIEWMQNYPVLFINSWLKFVNDAKEKGLANLKVDVSREGFQTLIATK